MTGVRDVLAGLLRRKAIPRGGFQASLFVGTEFVINYVTPGPLAMAAGSFALAACWLVALAHVDWEETAEEVNGA